MVEGPKSVTRETDAEAIGLARRLVRTSRHGALAVIEPGSGAPLASRVGVATDMDGGPLILVSALSEHTGAMLADPRCSLLLGEPGKGDPLAHPRISLVCLATRLARGSPEGDRARRRYLNRHPKAGLYVDLGDFCFFRLEPERASLNGGFGRAYRLARHDLLTEGSVNAGLAAAEQGAIVHMNSDHRDAIALYARHFAGAPDGDWIITGIDADGMDLACGDQIRRVPFPSRLGDADELRAVLVAMAREARSAS